MSDGTVDWSAAAADAQRQLLELIERGQQAIVASVQQWTEATGMRSAAAGAAAPPDDLGAEAMLRSQFDFAEKVLAAQRRFAEQLLSAVRSSAG
jgi:hypothetical protein